MEVSLGPCDALKSYSVHGIGSTGSYSGATCSAYNLKQVVQRYISRDKRNSVREPKLELLPELLRKSPELKDHPPAALILKHQHILNGLSHHISIDQISLMGCRVIENIRTLKCLLSNQSRILGPISMCTLTNNLFHDKSRI